MNGHSLEIDRIAPTRQPDGSPVGYQSWRDLAFIHWRVPIEEIQALLPDPLMVDTFDGSAWVGLVPFAMRKVRPWWSPSVSGISNFLETNVRTYVHKDGRDPGVWFFSLEASQSLAVRLARKFWNLPYYYAGMSLNKNANQIHYQSNRYWPDPIPARTISPSNLINPRINEHSKQPLPIRSIIFWWRDITFTRRIRSAIRQREISIEDRFTINLINIAERSWSSVMTNW